MRAAGAGMKLSLLPRGLIFWGLATSAASAQDCDLLLRDATAALAQRDLTKAAAQLRLALPVCQQRQSVLLELARVYLLSEQLPECQKVLQELLAVEPRHSMALKLRGDAFYLAGKDREAEQSLRLAIESDPSNEEAHYALGRVLYQQSRADQARAEFARVLDLNPKSYRAHDNLALCYEGLGQDALAMKHYLKALELVHRDHPEYDWVYGNLANFLIKRGEYQRAFDLAVEAAQRNPGSGRNCYLAAKALTKLDKSDLSVRWLQRAIQLEPDYPDAHYLLAQVYRSQGKTEAAEQEFAKFREVRAKVPGRLR